MNPDIQTADKPTVLDVLTRMGTRIRNCEHTLIFLRRHKAPPEEIARVERLRDAAMKERDEVEAMLRRVASLKA